MRGHEPSAREHMSYSGGAFGERMRARCPDRGTGLQVGPAHNEKRVMLNCLDGGQRGAARCQVSLEETASSRNKEGTRFPPLPQSFRGERRHQRPDTSCSRILAGGSGPQAEWAPHKHSPGLHSRHAQGRAEKPGDRDSLSAHHFTGKTKAESLYTSFMDMSGETASFFAEEWTPVGLMESPSRGTRADTAFNMLCLRRDGCFCEKDSSVDIRPKNKMQNVCKNQTRAGTGWLKFNP